LAFLSFLGRFGKFPVNNDPVADIIKARAWGRERLAWARQGC